MSSWNVNGLELLSVKVFGLAISSQHPAFSHYEHISNSNETFYRPIGECSQLILSSMPAVTSFFSMCR